MNFIVWPLHSQECCVWTAGVPGALAAAPLMFASPELATEHLCRERGPLVAETRELCGEVLQGGTIGKQPTAGDARISTETFMGIGQSPTG